jgi:hypothetical protein
MTFVKPVLAERCPQPVEKAAARQSKRQHELELRVDNVRRSVRALALKLGP